MSVALWPGAEAVARRSDEAERSARRRTGGSGEHAGAGVRYLDGEVLRLPDRDLPDKCVKIDTLASGKLEVRSADGAMQNWQVSGGFFEVSRNRTAVLADGVSG